MNSINDGFGVARHYVRSCPTIKYHPSLLLKADLPRGAFTIGQESYSMGRITAVCTSMQKILTDVNEGKHAVATERSFEIVS